MFRSRAPGEVPPTEGRVSRVPNNFIGKLLDRGKPSAAAIKLLAIKFALGGPGFVVSKHRAAAHGMDWREYRSGLKLLKGGGHHPPMAGRAAVVSYGTPDHRRQPELCRD